MSKDGSVYLRRLEIAGFKSFGTRVKLDFRPGISAIVGPNGSGKSNVAEAIRWVLGEQNVRTLRTRKTEELIYAGSEVGKGQASMAEVILTLEADKLDNKRTKTKQQLGLSELVISRRLYRSGESEYRLAGRKVLVKDLQHMLAQVGFGTSSYTVIGQGMIDTLLIASPAERKLLFEEASGIRAFELERVDTVRKLARAREQAAQLRTAAAQLAPEQEILAHQVQQLDRLRTVRAELDRARRSWLAQAQARLRTAETKATEGVTTAQATAKRLAAELKQNEATAQALERAGHDAFSQQAKVIERLEELDQRRSKISEQIANAQAQINLQAGQANEDEKIAQLKQAIAAHTQRLDKFHSYLQELTQKNTQIELKIAECNTKISALNSELTKLRQQLNANQRDEHLTQALGLARMLSAHLQGQRKLDTGGVRLVVHKLIRMVKLAHDADMTSLPLAISKLQQSIARELGRREDIVEKQTTEIIKMRSVELDISAVEKDLAGIKAQLIIAEKARPTSRQTTAQQGSLDSLLEQRAELDQSSREQRAVLGSFSAEQTSTEQIHLAHTIEQTRAQLQRAEQDTSLHQADLVEHRQALAQLQRTAMGWKLVGWEKSAASDVSVDITHLTRLEAELAVLGDMDLSVTDAHQELADKITYINNQADDLEAAANDLSRVLKELERRIKQEFETNFAKINSSFGKHFASLFQGGTAALKLIPGEDEIDGDSSYGIEITAKPPGKRVELLASLSGGEKALAAIALLAAILDVNPSPFIVLDEVDAALDDANSTAFTKILRVLGKHSQLLVITHNHETMMQADELFGITSSSKTSSAVIAVDLREAEALAA